MKFLKRIERPIAPALDKRRIRAAAFLLFAAAAVFVYPVDIETALTSSNAVFDSDGKYPKIPDFGFRLVLKEDLGKNINGTLAIERSPGFGNVIRGRIAYVTDYINISIGPTLGFLNTQPLKRDFITLFQPGFGTGLSLVTPKGFSASVDADFSIAAVSVKQKGIFLQNGFFEIGWRFPNLLAFLKLSQKNKTQVQNSSEITIIASDMGLYTTAFSKPSRIKIPVNIFYRGIRFENGANRTETGNIMVESGFTHTVSSGFEWFVKFGAAVYSFDLATKAAVKGFFFDAELGLKFTVGN